MLAVDPFLIRKWMNSKFGSKEYNVKIHNIFDIYSGSEHTWSRVFSHTHTMQHGIHYTMWFVGVLQKWKSIWKRWRMKYNARSPYFMAQMMCWSQLSVVTTCNLGFLKLKLKSSKTKITSPLLSEGRRRLLESSRRFGIRILTPKIAKRYKTIKLINVNSLSKPPRN